MGDQNEEEEEEEMKMALLCPPVYPLPEEIKTMEPSETVCRFCGVSYLIFHEFQQLRDRLSALEAELQEARGAAGREKAQREALQLGRREWETAFRLEVTRKTAEAERDLREELEEKHERRRRDMEQELREIGAENEQRLRRELGEEGAERLRRQREELQRAAAEGEKVLSDALLKANKTSDESRKHLRQLEERLAEDARTRQEAERAETRRREALRGVCVQQRDTLRRTRSLLAACGAELADIQGFLSHLTGAWQVFRSQILQHSTQVFSALRDELKNSIAECQKMSERKENLTRQLMEQRRQSEEQQEELLRLNRELADQRERWSSCQQRCESAQEQLSSWQRREAEASRKRRAAEEEAVQLRGDAERVRQEASELRTQRETLIESHRKTVTKMEEDYTQELASKLVAALEEQRSQNALRLKELELEMRNIGEKNQLLLLQHQQDNAQLQRRLQERDGEIRALREERRAEEEEEERRRTLEELERRKEEELRARLQEAAEANGELQAEVALLQETVSRECEEREQLTAALRHAQSELHGLRSSSWHQRGPPASPSHHPQRLHAPRAGGRSPLSRPPTPPHTLRPPHTPSDAGGGCAEARGGEGSLPRLRGTSTANRRLTRIRGRKESF